MPKTLMTTQRGPIRLYFSKEFTRGNLRGIKVNESLKFTDAARARAWVAGILASCKHSLLNYKLTDYSFTKYWRS